MEAKVIGIRNNRATLQSEKGNEALKITNDKEILIKNYEERILGVVRVKHGISFVDVSIPYYGYKLSLCLERIEYIGEFTLFCLHAFGDGLNLNKLSQVTEIDSMTIQKHLDFLVKRGFVNEKHKISTYGCNILKLHDEINKFNRTNRVVFLENAVREKIKRWRERQELTDRSYGWLIAGEDLSLQEFEELYNARKDIN
ncbi:hypothetical protein CHA185_12870 [Helicobacter pylori]